MAEGIYDVGLTWEGKEFDLPRTNYGFIMEDSIYEYFPKAKIMFQDNLSEFRELLITVPGMGWGITYGYDSEFLKSSYIVEDDSLEGRVSPNIVGGGLQVDLIHSVYSEQEIVSKKHSGGISSIVQSIASKYNYNSVNIPETSGNDDEWFQFQKKDSEFILKSLMPYIYSGASNDSPFYVFTDSKNNFNLKSFKNMYNSSPVADVKFTGNNTESSTGRETAFNIDPFRQRFSGFKDVLRRKLTYIDKNGEYQVIDDFLEDHPSDSRILSIKADKGIFTGNQMLVDETENRASKDNIKGQYIQALRRAMMTDKLIITLPFNPKIISGKTINVSIPQAETNKELFIMSDKYLVERSKHIWTGEKGFTDLIVGRRNTNVTNEYKFRSQLIGG